MNTRAHFFRRLFAVVYLAAAFALPFGAFAQVTNGLVAWYQLDGDATNSSGAAHHGVISNGVSPTNDRFGRSNRAMHFDGSSGYIRVPSQLTATNPFTWALWFKPQNNSQYSLASQGGNPGANAGIDPGFYVNQSGSLGRIRFFNSGNELFSAARTWTPFTSWYHLVVTSTTNGQRYLYVNGVSEASGSNQPFLQNLPNFYIGADAAYSQWYFLGDIDDVRVYDRALTASEVQQLYSEPGPGTISGTLAYPGTQQGDYWIVITNLTGSQIATNIGALLDFSIPELLRNTNYWLRAYRDSNANGLNDYWEAAGAYTNNPIWLTNSITNADIVLSDPLVDSDADGLPDWWEIQFGLNPTNILDATASAPNDQLTYMQKYQYGLKGNTNDFDGDGLTDYAEIFVWHSNPIAFSTLTNGVSDGTNVAAGRSPNFLGTRYFYDKNDRLTGVEHAKGLALGYRYDGNGNILGQAYLGLDANSNGLPDLYEFLNGLTNNASAYADSDGDGWSDYQEWQAGTNPSDANNKPDVLGLPGAVIASMSWPFAVNNFVIGVGQFDGDGLEEIVVGADGNPGTNMNFLLVLSQTSQGWMTQRVDIGPFGITSLAVGQPAGTTNAAIYLGTRLAGGTGTVIQVKSIGNIWQPNPLTLGSTGNVAYVLGVDSLSGVAAQFSASDSPPNSLFSLLPNGTNWTTALQSPEGATRALGGMTEGLLGTGRQPFRLLSQGGIEVGGSSSAPTSGLVGYWGFDGGNGNDFSGNNLHGYTSNNPIATAGKSGGGMSFTGSNYLVVPYNSLLDVSTGLTISLWFKANTWSAGANHMFGRIRSGNFTIYRILQNSGILQFYLQAGFSAAGELVAVPAPATGQWHHVAATWAGTTMQIYLDGQLAASTNTSVAGSIQNATNALYIARKEDFPPTEFYDGSLDEIRLYSRALSAQEAAGLYQMGWRLSEPAATRTNNWRGPAFASGLVRNSGLTSLFYSSVDDRNANGATDPGDAFVLAEYLLPPGDAAPLWFSNTSQSVLGASSYGQASVNYRNATNDVLFTGEPDGRVFSWIATNATGPLQRQLFSAFHTNKAWHAMAGVKTFNLGEGLLGLRVSSNAPNVCDVVFWPPQSQLPVLATVPQTAPTTALLPVTNALGGSVQIPLRVWDAEGNSAWLFLQYSNSFGLGWSNVAIASIDGAAYAAVAAMPTGMTHLVAWNAGAVFAAGTTNSVWLRARAQDVTLTGNWSPAVAYSIVIPAISVGDGIPNDWRACYFGGDGSTTNNLSCATCDPDGDHFNNWQEYITDTNPTNSASHLNLSVSLLSSAPKLDWLAGSNSWKYLQRADSLNATNVTWLNIWTSPPPPSPDSGSYTDSPATNAAQFYRIKATR